MGIRFRKTIKLGNLIKLNISKSGVSATIGKNGASINLGSNGTYLNLSPTAAGIKGTGISYRKKITGGFGGLLSGLVNKVTNKNEEPNKEINSKENPILEDNNDTLETNMYLYKYTDNVLKKADLDAKIEGFDNEASKQLYKLAIDGDEDTIESLVGAFLDNLDLSFDVKANYELEDKILYVDLDLPEIENFPKIKKEEYAKVVMSLGIYLTSNFFNISSYIEQIVLSAFTTKRDNKGDLKDEYLYSVKFNRNEYENTDLTKLEDPYNFILKFENRINMSSTYSFKAVEPYEMESTIKTNSILDEVKDALVSLGYKVNDISEVLTKISELKLENSGDYLKEALKLLNKN